MTVSESAPGDQQQRSPAAGWVAWTEAAYRWTGWVSGLPFLGLARGAPNPWLGLALGLFGVCLIGHWVTERAEAARGQVLVRARQVEALLLFVGVPTVAAIGMWSWAAGGFPGWR